MVTVPRARVVCPVAHVRWNDVSYEYEPVPCPLASAPHPYLVGEPGPFEAPPVTLFEAPARLIPPPADPRLMDDNGFGSDGPAINAGSLAGIAFAVLLLIAAVVLGNPL